MIKKVTFVFAFILASFTVSAQVGIGTPDPNASSILEIKSPDRGIGSPKSLLSSIKIFLNEGWIGLPSEIENAKPFAAPGVWYGS